MKKKKCWLIGLMCVYTACIYASKPWGDCQVDVYDYGDNIVLDCDNNIFRLINAAGDVNFKLTLFNLTIIQTSIPDMIYLNDAKHWKGHDTETFLSIKSFYEVLNRKPNTFTKSIMKHCLYQAIIEKPCKGNWLIIGWELLKGDIIPRDTILGKHFLQLVTSVSADSLDQYILPFWRDSVYDNIYVQRHDSLLKEWGNRRNNLLTMAIEDHGDTLAYKELIKDDIDGHAFIYSIYMIDQYNYMPAYKDLPLSLIKCYKYNKLKSLGKKAYLWIYEILMENAENIPDDIFKETISILHSYPLQNK